MKDARAAGVLSESPDATFRLGRGMAGTLGPGSVVAIRGELGSGKTVLVQGICSGLGVTGFVTSPTFTLIQEYHGRLPVYHFDLYRLENLREIEDLDMTGYFESGGVSLIEWAERAGPLLPKGRIEVAIDRVGEKGKILEGSRRIRIGRRGAWVRQE
jgi:tRNA threonylcarbamoyladenosine biosynthesis protein TsaE